MNNVVPAISHIICLTNIRSMPWIEQMVARAVRIDPYAGPYERQRGYIFAPADKLFVQLAADIEADQTEALAEAKKKMPSREPGQESLFGDPRPGITPLSSKLTHIKGRFDTVSLFGDVVQLPPQKTQREIEAELRDEIDIHVKKFCRVYACKIAFMNRELKERYGKARENMTVGELTSLRSYVSAQYPVPEQKPINHAVLAARWR